MSSLVKIQKVMKVFSIIAKIVFVVAIVGTVLLSVAATLVATDVINEQNDYMHFITNTANITKSQLVGVLVASAIVLVFEAVFTGFVCSYFTEELKEGTPFTNAGAKRVMVLGILEMIFSVVTMGITDGINEKILISMDDAGGFTFGICLIFLSLLLRYGAELEQKTREK